MTFLDIALESDTVKACPPRDRLNLAVEKQPGSTQEYINVTSRGAKSASKFTTLR